MVPAHPGRTSHLLSREEERMKQGVAHQPLIIKVTHLHLFYWCLCVHCGVIHANLWDSVLLSEEWQRITFLSQKSKILRKPYFHKYLKMTSKWSQVSLDEQFNMVNAVHTHKWKWTHTGINKLLHQFLPTWTVMGFRSLSIVLTLALVILNVYSSNRVWGVSTLHVPQLQKPTEGFCSGTLTELPRPFLCITKCSGLVCEFLRARASPGCQQETAFCTPGQAALLLSWGRTGNRCLFAFLLQRPILSWSRKICEDDMAYEEL